MSSTEVPHQRGRPTDEYDGLRRALRRLRKLAGREGMTVAEWLRVGGYLDDEAVEALEELCESQAVGYPLSDVICERLAREIGIDPWDMVGHSARRAAA